MSAETEMIPLNPHGGVLICSAIRTSIDDKAWEVYGVPKPFMEDKYGTQIEDGPYYPPSFKWYTTIQGRRRKDGECFYVAMSFLPADVHEGQVAITKFQSQLGRAILAFNSFSDCECKAGHPCKRHGGA